jgi:alanine-synthesizing transaminase
MAIPSEFHRIKRLPPYVFAEVDALKMEARRRGEDIIDLGMGNPDKSTPPHIVEKLVEAAQNPKNHRYSASKGIYRLRCALSDWYKRRYGVAIDPETEAIVTIGAKEGLSHFVLSAVEPGSSVIVPNPTYPIHTYSVIIAGGDIRSIPLVPERDFFSDLMTALKLIWPRPVMMIISFPHNPTGRVVDRAFFTEVVRFARENNVIVVHDFAYADIVFDGYRAPSFLEIDGAMEVGIEFTSVSKSYNMPGWRVGFAAGNRKLIAALARMKSYFDYGIFQPIQIAAIIALSREEEGEPLGIAANYAKRRDALVEGLARAGWEIEKPKGTMFVWAKIPDKYRHMGSLEFSKFLLREAKVAVAPGVGFGSEGDPYVRFALVENTHRITQAVKGIRKIL